MAFPFVCAVLVLWGFIVTPVAAQPTGYQEYYVLGYEEHVWRAFLDIYDGSDGDIPNRICSTVSLVATADYQVIYYDHWEDGYEGDLLKPVQSTTRVYGDANLSNGGTGSDILLAGDDINLTSDQNNTTINGYVPVNPRNPNHVRYDGGDRIISSGGPVDLTHAMWPLDNPWVGGAWEVYSRQAYADAFSYRLPIGEDLYVFGGGTNGIYGDFRNVYLQLAAFEDNTTVSIDNGSDVVNLTLDRGHTYSSMGYIRSSSAPAIAINAGTRVRSSKPIQVGLVTGADSDVETFQGRFLIFLPDRLWGADYVVPVPRGDDTVLGRDAPAEIYLSNPNDFPITVKAFDRATQTSFVISPTGYISATVPYSQKRGGLGHVPQDSAVRFTSADGTFGVVVCADTSDFTFDWGFSGIPAKYLTQDYYIPWAPGTTDLSANGSPVWVAPLADDTIFYVDFSPLDDVVDQTFTLDMLEQQRIFDPDNDNTGMHVWASGKFAVAWGEDPQTGGTGTRYLDLGVTTLPLLQRWLDPVLTMNKSAEPTILPRSGGSVTFTLTTRAHNAPLVGVSITDTLPISWTYVPDSTHVTFPDGGTATPDPAIDGRTLFWDLSASLGLNQGVTLVFQAEINDTDGVAVSVNQAEAIGEYEYANVFFNPSDEASVYISPLKLTKSVSSTQAEIGDTLVYTLTYANTSDSASVTNVTLRDAVPLQYVAFQSASDDYVYDDASGTIIWSLGTLAPGASDSVTFTVVVNDFVEDGTVIENVGYIDSDQTVEAGSDVVRTTVLAPQVEFTKSGPTVATRDQVITYTLSYENAGGAPATGVVIQDVIPAHTTYVAGSMAIDTGSGWVPLTDAVDGDLGAYVPPALTFDLGTIAAGEAGSIRFNVWIDDGLAGGTLIQNWATLDRDLGTPRESNLAVTRISDLLLAKAADRAQVAPGGMISYTLTYQNVSTTTDQTEVYVREPIPDYTSLVIGSVYGADQVEYSCNHGATWSPEPSCTPVTHLRWYDADMPTDTQVTVGFSAQVTTTVPSHTTIDNIAHITSTETAMCFCEWIPSNQVKVAVIDIDMATIYGRVFEDVDGDGVRDTGEWGIPEVSVTLDDVVTVTTDLNGDYSFLVTVPGVHTVVETDPSIYSAMGAGERYTGYGDLLSPLDFGFFSTTPNEVSVDVTLGSTYRVDFGDMHTKSNFASIYGIVFDDVDGDGVRDVGEVGMPGVRVALDGAVSKITDLNGSYTFSTTVVGTHTIVEEDPTGYFSTTSNEVRVPVILGKGYLVDFGDAAVGSGFATIHGTVFEDMDGDGTWGGGELGIPDVFVTLDGVVTRTTDINGNYTFSTPLESTHTVVETDPDEYLSTTSNELQVDVMLGAGYQLDFGDQPLNQCDADIYEEDDSAAQARVFVLDTSQAHQFCDDDTDWVKFSARVGSVYTITTYSWGRRVDTFLTLLDADGYSLLAASDDHKWALDYSSQVVWQPPAGGVYYVRVTNRGGLTGYHTEYDLVIEGQSRSSLYLPWVIQSYGAGVATGYHTVAHPLGMISHSCPDAYEIDDTWQQAHSVGHGDVQVHSFDSDPTSYAADKDYLWFEDLSRKTVVFTVDQLTNTQTLLELYDGQGAALFVTGTTRLAWIPFTGGRYYLGVTPQDGTLSFGCADTAGYRLSMEAQEAYIAFLPTVTRSR